MLHLLQAVGRVVSIGRYLGKTCAARTARTLRMLHRQRLVGEAVGGSGHVIAAHRIALHALHFTSADIIVPSFPNGAARSQAGHHPARKQTFAVTGGVVAEFTGGKALGAYKAVTVIIVPDVHSGARRSHFVGAYTLLRQAVQAVVLVIRPVTGGEGALVAVLRENQAVGIVIHHFHISCTGKFLPDTAVQAVVFVLEGIQIKIGRALVHGLEHKAEVAFVVIHIVGVVRFAAFHLTRQYNMSHLIGKGVAHVQVFIGGFNNRKLTGKIAYRKQKADDSRSQTEKQIPCLYSKDISRESFSLLNQRFGDLGTMGEEHTLKQNILSYQETSKYKIPFFRKCIIRFLPTSFSG